MNAVTFLLVYAAALSWLAPTVLASPIVAGVHPRLAVTGWLTAVATASIAWAAALVILITSAAHSLYTHTAPTFCVETLGITGAMTLPPTIATALVVVLVALTTAVATHTGYRLIGTLRRIRRSNAQHAEAVRLVGRPTDDNDVVVITADEPTAYCVSGGRRSAIVITTGARELLNPSLLAAVLAHEKAHLRGRHHHIIATLKAFAAALPRLPLMRAAASTVPTLLEMCADDAAARQHGRRPLVASLITLSTRHRLPDGALAAAGTAVTDRVVRLIQPPRQTRWRPQALTVSLAVTATLVTPILAFTLCTL